MKIRSYAIVLFLSSMLILSSQNIFAQYVVGSSVIGSGVNQLDISVEVDSSFNRLRFEISGPELAWFGFSFNTQSMSPGSYTIIANVNGGNPAEYDMVQHAAPTLHAVQNLQSITSSTSSGRKTFVFYRDNTTNDVNDYVFSHLPGSLDIAWGYGTGLSFGYHSNRGGSSISFINPCLTVPPTVLPVIHICQGDSVQIFGEYRSFTGNYSQHIPVLLGCDSIVTQHLIVNQPTQTTLPLLSLCQGDSILLFGSYVHTGGIYYDTLQSVHLCDSILVQTLIVDTIVQLHLADISICYGDSAMVFGQWIFSSGIFTDTVQSPHSCDSIVFQRVDVIYIDTMVLNTGFSLQAVSGYDNYQWIDCINQQPAQGTGANSSVFTPLVNGLYKVLIENDSCYAESNCHQVVGLSVPELIIKPMMIISPNPAVSYARINLSNLPFDALLVMIDVTGKQVYEWSPGAGDRELVLDLSQFRQGLYFIRLYSSESIVTHKLIVRQ